MDGLNHVMDGLNHAMCVLTDHYRQSCDINAGTNFVRSKLGSMEVPMDINALARELAGLRIDSGYAFENGTPFYQPLNVEQAKRLLRALRDRGFIVSHREVDSPPIQDAGHQHDPVHH